MIGFETGAEAIPVRWYDLLDSTNAEARRLAEAGQRGPLWIAARRQSQGRGRRGRAWDTRKGNLAATLLASTRLDPGRAALISFLAAFAVRDLAREFVPAGLVRLKWPNDVLLDGAKLSGILIESGRRPHGDLWLAIGIGVNLASAPSDLDYPAACLADHLKSGVSAPPTPEAALVSLSAKLAMAIAVWLRAGFAPFRDEWLRDAAGLGGPCTARLGKETVEGVAEGLDVDGALLLRLEDGALRRITAGDVFFGGTL